LHLLIDAFLRRANQTLAFDHNGSTIAALTTHAERYVAELQGDLGRVQLAVLAECLAETGTTALFVERYLNIRRELGVNVIKQGQRNGEITATRPAAAIYDQIYGTIFYRSQFQLGDLNKAFVRALVGAALRT